MLSTKPVLPNFLKTLLITTMAFGSVAAFAGDHKKGEKIGDLKDMKDKQTLKADEMSNKVDAEVTKTSLTAESKKMVDKGEKMADKAEKAKPEE